MRVSSSLTPPFLVVFTPKQLLKPLARFMYMYFLLEVYMKKHLSFAAIVGHWYWPILVVGGSWCEVAHYHTGSIRTNIVGCPLSGFYGYTIWTFRNTCYMYIIVVRHWEGVYYTNFYCIVMTITLSTASIFPSMYILHIYSFSDHVWISLIPLKTRHQTVKVVEIMNLFCPRFSNYFLQ